MQTWLWATAALLLLGLVLLVSGRTKGAEPTNPAGLPRAPEGWEPLRTDDEDELVQAVRRSGESRARYFRAELPSGQPVALGHSPRNPWVDVFVRRRQRADPPDIETGPYETYSYHLRDERWSYGAVPSAGKELERLIRQGFEEYLSEAGRR